MKYLGDLIDSAALIEQMAAEEFDEPSWLAQLEALNDE